MIIEMKKEDRVINMVSKVADMKNKAVDRLSWN